ncbi:MAG: hypothetical protein ABIN91_23235 [Mucilaginibacter sp.]|uniref:hypothetical protein n=1 Tax=Mucilaginibacter sp. TaxID=1882438 RepID=UPI00326375C8
MKKFILLIVLFFNILPYIKNGKVLVSGPSIVYAQTISTEIVHHNDGDGNGEYCTEDVSTSNPVYEGPCADIETITGSTEIDCDTGGPISASDGGGTTYSDPTYTPSTDPDCGSNGQIPELPPGGGNPYPAGEGAGPNLGGAAPDLCSGFKDTYNKSFKADGSKKEQSGYLVDDKHGGTMFIENPDANHTDGKSIDLTYTFANNPNKYAKANGQYYKIKAVVHSHPNTGLIDPSNSSGGSYIDEPSDEDWTTLEAFPSDVYGVVLGANGTAYTYGNPDGASWQTETNLNTFASSNCN